jgi:hypothetical protein
MANQGGIQVSEQLSGNPEQLPYTPTTEEVLYCSSCWADLKLYPPSTEIVFERDFTVNTETVRKVYRYVRTDATEFDRWLAEVKAQERERIVKLIEPEYGRGWVTAASFVRHLVALIKGEEQ